MPAAGMIIEYNPLHSGHVYLMEETRRQLGAETPIIGVMSGDFVQRGDFALLRRQARARAAVESGVDLVLELPLPWAVSSAERFADGGVQTLLATGLVTHLTFGSECGDAAALREIAACLLSEAYQTELRSRLGGGASYAACRQSAVEALLGKEPAALLETPNNNLGVEYCKALLRHGACVQPVTTKRLGAAHDGEAKAGEYPSASVIRDLLRQGEHSAALELMAPAMRTQYLAEEAAGRTPVFSEHCERAVLARLRSMSRAEFAALDEGQEGLGHRLYDAVRETASLEEALDAAKTKRYAYARLRRMALWAYLGIVPAERPAVPLYLRPLAANAVGRELLAKMRKTAVLPVLAKPNHVRRLSPEAQRLFEQEVRAADLYALAYPDLSAARGGSLWKEMPDILALDPGKE
ncbi:MAG: nucleotidyltransferase family protein [Ruminococcaceae bacterium]|nr:nucleotidyltransferase family protein [Oscillospiraceae bacterium]